MNDRRVLFALLGLLILVVLWRYVFSGDSSVPVVAASESIPKSEMRLEKLRQLAATVPGKEEVLKRAKAELAKREKGIIVAPTAPQAQAQLLDVIRHAGIANGFDPHGVDSMPQPKALGSDYGEVSVTQTFSCGIDQLVNFLAALANEPQILSSNEIQVSGGNDKRKNVQVRLNLSGVVSKKLVPEKKGGASF